jgi:DNA-binding transcriptional regulator YhcF (GntR family)
VLPFPVDLRPGDSPVRQVVRAAARAILGGVLQPGDRFPSVRELAEALKLHPNTAQKVVTQLQQEGLLVARPGVGTIVQAPPAAEGPDARRLAAIEAQLDRLVVEARQAGLDAAALAAMLAARWQAAFGAPDAGVPDSQPARTAAGADHAHPRVPA